MEIVAGDVWSGIKDPRNNLRALSYITEICRARPNGYKYMKKYRMGVWDGYISVMGGFNKFPSGLLSDVVFHLQSKNYNVVISRAKDLTYDEIVESSLIGIKLRDYQIQCANQLLAAQRGVAKMATNSGKTEVIAALVKAFRFPKTLVIIHRKELLHQTAARLSDRLGIAIGKIGDGVWSPGNITVAMIQTIHKSDLSFTIGNNLVIVDECHNISSDSMMKVMMEVPGHCRYGFSGTPLKREVLSDMRLVSATGNVVVDIGNKFLVDNEWSAKPTIKISVVSSNNGWELKYASAYDECIVNNEVRNKLIQYLASDGGGVLIVVNRIEHGLILRRMIPGSIFVCGSDSSELRMSILQDMRTKDGVYISSTIFDEGVDVPGVDTVILACGGKSQVRLLQRIGRGMRRKEGKANELTVYDFIDDTNKYLLKHSENRINTYEQEGFETSII